MTYDTADRLITRQDGVQRGASKSTYYEYDIFGRQTEMGTKNTFNVKTPLLKNFYDNYNNLTATNLALNTSASSDNAFPNNSSPNARGLLTGTWSALLNNTSTGYYTSYYYGSRERLVQSHAQNHLGGVNDTYYTYNYIGTTATRKQVHSATGQNTQTELYTYTYDNGDRLLNTTYRLNGGTAITLSAETYDAVGRLGTHMPLNIETQTYTYNVRSWPTSITSTNFTEKLAYYKTVGGLTPEDVQYGGNIGAMQWQTGNESRVHSFQFSYTPLGWLEWADYYDNISKIAYDVFYSYDKMGNMTGFQRNGYIEDFYSTVDSPYFTYNGNQPTRIDDSDYSLTFPYNNGYHFIDYVQQNDEYTYDDNGNMTQDLNKRISSIQYNLLNLPQNITFSTGSTIAYTYDAEGRKLNVTYGSPSKTINYSGNMVYENGTLKQILTEGGYVTLSGTTPTYHAYIRDHQGNNRVVINNSGTIEQVNHYYPFGYFFAETTNADTQRYKYNDKEFDMMHGLNWYDYGARHYDPAMMRFTTMDPMCEKYYHLSPYAYCGNNPVNAVDPTGNDIRIWNDEDNSYFTYSIGMKYHGNDNFANKVVSYLNKIGSLESGSEVLSELISSKNHYDIMNNDSEGGESTMQFVGYKDGGGQINASMVMNSDYSDNVILGALAHESYHGYEKELGQNPATINGEVDAYLFENHIKFELGGTSGKLGLSTFIGNIYSESMNNLIWGTSWNKYLDYMKAVSSFKYGSAANKMGIYNNHKISNTYRERILNLLPQ
ncbi:MAG: hypothetical protein IJ159_00780 [Prevotella sp.]|nr:hypothetical protein [Prevotella sp.]